MLQQVVPGKSIDALTPDEARDLFRSLYKETVESRVRAAATIALDASGNGQDEVYTVPAGFEFEARRVVLDLNTAADPSTGSVVLNVAGKYVQYLRSGTVIEYGNPVGSTGSIQVPGKETWSREQGPYFRNDEVFEVKVVGLTASAILKVWVEGILRRLPPLRAR